MASAYHVLIASDDIISQNRRKMQVLREDQDEMLATRASIDHELSVSHQQLRQVLGKAIKVRDECDLKVKGVLDKCIVVESHVGGIQALESEHAQVVAYITNLTRSNIKLESELNNLHSELRRIRMDASDVSDLKSDLHAMRLQLRKGRGAIEFEKKTRSSNLRHYQELDAKITKMNHEIHTLRAQLTPSNPDLGYAAASDMPFQGHYDANYQATAPLPVAASDATPHPTGGHHPFETRHAY